MTYDSNTRKELDDLRAMREASRIRTIPRLPIPPKKKPCNQ